MFKKFQIYFFILLLSFSVTSTIGCFDDETDEELVAKESIIVTYENDEKLIAYSKDTGEKIKEVFINSKNDSDPNIDWAAAKAMTVYNNKLFLACGENTPRLYIFNEALEIITEINISTWASTGGIRNPNDILIVSSTEAYITLMGDSSTQEGMIVKFNPTDVSHITNIVVNKFTTAGHYDHPNKLYSFDNKIYTTVLVTDGTYPNYSSYVYNITENSKFDLTAKNVQYSAGYENFLYCSGDTLDVINLNGGPSKTTITPAAGDALYGILINGTKGILNGGYQSVSPWGITNKIWSFDASAGTGTLTEVINDWGGAAVLGKSNYNSDDIYAIVSDEVLRIYPFTSSDIKIQSSETLTNPGAVITFKVKQ